MATVYRGVYRPTGMPVAIKVLSEESAADEVLVHRMHQEARIQNVLGRQHPGIVTCYEEIGVEGRPAMVLEFVPGRSVVDVVDDEWPFAEVAAIEVIFGVLAALARAHAQGIVHREGKGGDVVL